MVFIHLYWIRLRKTQFVGGQIEDVCLQLSVHLVANNMGGGWSLVWSLEAPPVVKNFMWRMF